MSSSWSKSSYLVVWMHLVRDKLEPSLCTEKMGRILQNDCKHFGTKTEEHELKENTKRKHLPTPCKGRSLKDVGRLARCSLDDGL